MSASLVIRRFEAIEPALCELCDTAQAEGYGFMTRLITAWRDGSNRFDRPGECYLGVWQQDRLIAAGGLNRDPYCNDAGIGRVRHVYVCPADRRSGAGSALLSAIVAAAQGNFRMLRLRTTTARGAAFYEALGFIASADAAASHALYLAGLPPAATSGSTA